jgi:glycosyltransferase involved in cell wall biosynthesis
MKIAIDGRELQGTPTGVGRFLGQLLAAWNTMPEAHGHEFVLLTPEGPDHGTLWEQLDLPTLVRRAGADVLFCPAYTAPLRPTVPVVVAIHDVSFAAHPEWFGWREGARRRTLARLGARAAARVITISHFSKREIASYFGVDPSRIVVVYPGVTAFGETRERGASGRVLFVGSIFNRRHVPELIDGFARVARTHPDLHLDIVGDNRTSPHINVQAVAAASGVGDRIHLRSYVTDDELRELYAASSAFAFLSEYEGFGLTPLEALASGIPSLLLDTAVGREVFGDSALYVKHPDPAEIEEGLRTLLFESSTRERLAASGASVLCRYSWEHCARAVLNAIVEATHE